MEMKAVYSRPKYLRPMLTYYCAGCQHGIVSKLLTELGLETGTLEYGGSTGTTFAFSGVVPTRAFFIWPRR